MIRKPCQTGYNGTGAKDFDARVRWRFREGMSRMGGIRPCGAPADSVLGGCLQGRRRSADPPAAWGKSYGTLESFVASTPPASMRAHSEPALIRRIAPVFASGVLPERGVTWRPVVLAASFVSRQRQRSRLPRSDNAPVCRGFFEGHVGKARLGEVASHLAKRITFALGRVHE